MRKNTSLVISVATPCHESWDKMTPAERGRFCQSCQKTVTDFTNLSDRQLMELISSNQGSTCGRFNAAQLNRTVAVPPQKKRRPLSIAAIVAALTVVMPSAKAVNTLPTVQVLSDKEDMARTPVAGTPTSISGVVIDDASNSPIESVRVTIKGKGSITALTDSLGRFRLQLPAGFKSNAVTIELTHTAYVGKEVEITLKKGMKPIFIQMEFVGLDIIGKYGVNEIKEERSMWIQFKGIVNSLWS